jgi:hypothetical protein
MAYRRFPRELRGEIIACQRFALPVQIVAAFRDRVSPATIYSWIRETWGWTEEDWREVEAFVPAARAREWPYPERWPDLVEPDL